MGFELLKGSRTVINAYVICISINVRAGSRTIWASMPIVPRLKIEGRWLYGVLAKAEVDIGKLGVGEERKVVWVEPGIFWLWILWRYSVQVGNVLRYVRTPPLGETRHDVQENGLRANEVEC